MTDLNGNVVIDLLNEAARDLVQMAIVVVFDERLQRHVHAVLVRADLLVDDAQRQAFGIAADRVMEANYTDEWY